MGGKGTSDTEDAASHGDPVAICDVDGRTLDKMGEAHPKAARYYDYRTMLAEMGDKIDAVTVSTPDHTHAPAAAMAMRMGKHAFVQKPLTWSIEEARYLRELAAEKSLCTQMGNQGTASDGLRSDVERIRSGVLGDVREIHIWTNRPIWPQGISKPTETPGIPAHLHWCEWLAAAPDRPYHPAYHPFKWRGWLDFGTGALGDMACHEMNMPVMALGLFDPAAAEVVATSGLVDGQTYAAWSVVKLEFPAVDGRAACQMFWYEGGKNLPEEHQAYRKYLEGREVGESGTIVVGSEAQLGSGGNRPTERFRDYPKPEQTLPRSPGHFTEFAQAIEQGKPEMALSNFAYAGRLTETVLTAVLAQKLNRRIEWDAQAMQVKGCPEAEPMIRRVYRPGFSLRGV